MPSVTASENVALVVTAAAALAATGALALTLWSKARIVRGTGAPLLRGFRLTRVLKVAEREVSLLGTFASDPLAREAVVTIQKTAFDTRELETLLQSLSLHTILENDIYSTYVGDVSRAVKPFKVNVIHPATETHVRKHSDQQFHVVVETQELYERVTRIFIRTSPKEKIEWVYNILDQYVAAGKGLEFKGFLTDEEVLPPCSRTESERIVFEDTHPTNGFILLPDFKWSDTSNVLPPS
jgi:m7GpppX diphosphatase